MSNRIAFLLSLLLVGVTVSATSVHAAPVVCLVTPGTTSCPSTPPTIAVTVTSVPHDFSLELWVTGAADYDEFFVDGLEWDPAVLELVSVEPGSLSDPFLFYSFDLDNAVGTVGLSGGSFDAGVSGSGQLAVLNFRALAINDSSIVFSDLFGGEDFVFFQGPQTNFEPAAQVTGAEVHVVLQQIPEPGTGLLLLTALAASVVRRRAFGTHPAA